MTTMSANRRKDVAAKLVPQAAKASEAKGKSKVMARETASAYSLTLKASSSSGAKTVAKVVSQRSKTEAGILAKSASVMKATPVPGLCGKGLVLVGGKRELELRSLLKMTRSVFGRLVNVSERTIAEVESGKDVAKKLVRPYNEVYRLWESLSELIDPQFLGDWLQTPNQSFGDLKPIEVIERGNINLLWGMVFRLQTGMPG
jgi:transcriptional regulator with XRE-family HTH domain